jgi:hypothetical protein
MLPDDIDPKYRRMAHEWVGLVSYLTIFWTKNEAREEAWQRNRNSKKWGDLTYRVVIGDEGDKWHQQYWVCEDAVAARLHRMGYAVLPLD